MKIRTTEKNSYGRIVNFPEVGEIKVSEEGIIDVKDSVAHMLVKHTTDWGYVNEKDGENKEKVKKEEKQDTTDAEGGQNDKKETKVEDSKPIKELLEEKSKTFLKKTIKDIEGLSAKRIEKVTQDKETMIEFLISNFEEDEIKNIILA